MLSLMDSGGRDPGKPLVDTRVRLLNRKWGLKASFSKKDIPKSEAPTTTILKLIAILNFK